MSTPNPFNDPMYETMGARNTKLSITGAPPAPGDITTPAPNPFDVLPEYRRPAGPGPSLVGTFVKGVGSGVLHPVRAIVGSEEEEPRPDGWTLGNTIADFAGEMAGIGVSFLPFLKASQLALRGLGLGATTAAGAFVRTPAFAIAEGALSGMMFEAFSDIDEDPLKRIAIGGVGGAAAEGVLMGIGRAWRGRWGTTAPLGGVETGTSLVHVPRGQRLGINQVATDLNPIAVSMERNLHPDGGKSFDEAIGRLRAITDHKEQLQFAAARIVNQYQPYGFGILQGIENPGQAIRALRKQVGWEDVNLIVRAADPGDSGVTRNLAQAWQRDANGKSMYEILMIDTKARDQLALSGMSEQKVIETFMGEGPTPSFEKVLEILKNPSVFEEQVPIHVVDNKTLQAEWRRRTNRTSKVYGFASPGNKHMAGEDKLPGIWVSQEGMKPEEAVSTLVHEYVHHFSYWRSEAATGMRHDDGIFNVLFGGQKQNILRRAGLAEGQVTTADRATQMVQEVGDKVRTQLKDMTHEVISYFNQTTREQAVSIAQATADYFYRDNEMISRAFELMLVNPKKARELAPDVVEILSEQIHKHSPKLKMVLTKQEHKNIHMILEGLWKRKDDGATQLFWKQSYDFTDKMSKEFAEEGFFRGMNVRFQGEEWVVRPSTPAGVLRDGKVRIYNPMTKQIKEVAPREVHRPMMQKLAERNQQVVSRVQDMLKKPAEWLGVVVRERPILDEAATAAHPKGRKIERWAVRRGIVDLKNFERVDDMGTFLRQNREMHELVLEQIREEAGGRVGMVLTQEAKDAVSDGLMSQEAMMELLKDPNSSSQMLRELTSEDVLERLVRQKGRDGVVFNDQGRHLLYVANRDKALTLADEAISHRWVQSVDSEIDSPWIMPSQDNIMESLLREAGVSDRELDYFKGINPFTEQAHEVARQEGLLDRIMTGVMEVNQKAGPEPVEHAVSRAGLRMDRTTDGEYRLLAPDNTVVAASMSEDGIREYATALGPDPNMPDLEAGSIIKSDALPAASGGSSRPLKPFENPAHPAANTISQRFLDASQLFLATFTAMENVAKSAERRGFGPLFTKIFHPVQEALERVDNQLAGIPRDLLGGKTFNQQLKRIEELAAGPFFSKNNKERREMAVRALEIMSKEEIRKPGGLLKRGLTDTEVALADTFESLGLQHDLPRLTGTLRMAKSAIENKAAFPKRLAEMQRVEVSPEFGKALEQLSMMLDDMPDTVDGILKELGLSEKELTAVGMINNILSKGVDDQSLFAISRYASAKKLGAGFSSARDEFMSVNNFAPKERELVEEMEKLYKAAFQVSNLNHKKEIGGYWPHMRKWIENGFGPEEEFIRKHIPESVEWSAERIRTGELDPYLMDPTLVSAKYVRGMLMKQEFDPILPDVKASLANVEARDKRLHGIFTEYVHEATGRPHASFRKLHDVISTSTKILTGREPDERFTRDLVNSIGSLMNAASIPFRPVLIARNYFQMTQMIPPRTGVTEFFDGLRMAISEEGFKEAVEKNIVTKNVLPVHAASELYGYDTSQFNRRLQRVFAKGFEWYQKPDDIGRAAAFFGAKARIGKHMDDVMTGKISYETFKARAKINTYDSVDIAEFDKLFKAGRYTEASDYIGGRLARETIFRYGHANHPAGWGSVAGRLYGTFGTWPTQYKDFLLQGMTRGSTRDRLEFLAVHGAVNAATLAAGAAAGIDLMSWVAYPSLNYTGGPIADLTINVVQSFGGSPTEQSLAKRNIRSMFPSAEDPRSIFVPGSFFIDDLYSAMNPKPGEEAVFNLLGVKELHRESKNPFRDTFR